MNKICIQKIEIISGNIYSNHSVIPFGQTLRRCFICVEN